MDAIIETFHIDWKIIIAQAVNFGIVFVVLYLYALKPLKKIMAERSGKISQGLNDAKENARMLESTKQEYDNMIAKGRVDAQKIFEEGKREAQVKKDAMVTEAKAEVEAMITNGKKTLEGEKAKMVAEAKKEVVSVAVALAEKLMGSKGNFDEKALKDLNHIQ